MEKTIYSALKIKLEGFQDGMAAGKKHMEPVLAYKDMRIEQLVIELFRQERYYSMAEEELSALQEENSVLNERLVEYEEAERENIYIS